MQYAIIFTIIIGLSMCFGYTIGKGKIKEHTILLIAMGAYVVWSAFLIDSLYTEYQEKLTVEASAEEVVSLSIPEAEEDIEPIHIVTPSPTPTPIPEIVEEKPPVRYDFTDRDIYLMARLLCGSKYTDGDGEYDFDYGNDDRYDQISLVLCVVMNRVRDDRFPNTVEGVITQRYPGQPYQFSPVANWGDTDVEVSDIAIQRVTEWCDAYNRGPMGSQSVPENYVYFSSNGKGVNIVRKDL